MKHLWASLAFRVLPSVQTCVYGAGFPNTGKACANVTGISHKLVKNTWLCRYKGGQAVESPQQQSNYVTLNDSYSNRLEQHSQRIMQVQNVTELDEWYCSAQQTLMELKLQANTNQGENIDLINLYRKFETECMWIAVSTCIHLQMGRNKQPGPSPIKQNVHQRALQNRISKQGTEDQNQSYCEQYQRLSPDQYSNQQNSSISNMNVAKMVYKDSCSVNAAESNKPCITRRLMIDMQAHMDRFIQQWRGMLNVRSSMENGRQNDQERDENGNRKGTKQPLLSKTRYDRDGYKNELYKAEYIQKQTALIKVLCDQYDTSLHAELKSALATVLQTIPFMQKYVVPQILLRLVQNLKSIQSHLFDTGPYGPIIQRGQEFGGINIAFDGIGVIGEDQKEFSLKAINTNRDMGLYQCEDSLNQLRNAYSHINDKWTLVLRNAVLSQNEQQTVCASSHDPKHQQSQQRNKNSKSKFSNVNTKEVALYYYLAGTTQALDPLLHVRTMQYINNLNVALPPRDHSMIYQILCKYAVVNGTVRDGWGTDLDMQKLLNMTLQLMPNYDNTSLSMVAWGQASAGIVCQQQYIAVCRQFALRSLQLTEVEFANCLWAVATLMGLHKSHPEIETMVLCDSVANRINENFTVFSPQTKATCAWAVGEICAALRNNKQQSQLQNDLLRQSNDYYKEMQSNQLSQETLLLVFNGFVVGLREGYQQMSVSQLQATVSGLTKVGNRILNNNIDQQLVEHTYRNILRSIAIQGKTKPPVNFSDGINYYTTGSLVAEEQIDNEVTSKVLKAAKQCNNNIQLGDSVQSQLALCSVLLWSAGQLITTYSTLYDDLASVTGGLFKQQDNMEQEGLCNVQSQDIRYSSMICSGMSSSRYFDELLLRRQCDNAIKHLRQANTNEPTSLINWQSISTTLSCCCNFNYFHSEFYDAVLDAIGRGQYLDMSNQSLLLIAWGLSVAHILQQTKSYSQKPLVIHKSLVLGILKLMRSMERMGVSGQDATAVQLNTRNSTESNLLDHSEQQAQHQQLKQIKEIIKVLNCEGATSMPELIELYEILDRLTANHPQPSPIDQNNCSQLQAQVAETMKQLYSSERILEEVSCVNGIYSVDVVVSTNKLEQEQASKLSSSSQSTPHNLKGKQPKPSLALEVDGPHHYMLNQQQEMGTTVLRDILLKANGWKVAKVPYFDWPSNDESQRQYLEVLCQQYLS